jgi:DNA-binding NtrC family response regulator
MKINNSTEIFSEQVKQLYATGVSGYSETDRVRQAHALGAGAYVKKPYTIEKLGLAVKNELAG